MELEEIVLEGTAFERGIQFGNASKLAIHEFLKDHCARINRIRLKPLSLEKIAALSMKYAAVIQEYLPEIYEEICGLAKGADIQIHEAVLLQCRREIIQYQEANSEAEDCSTLALLEGQNSIVAQTIDLNADMTDLGTMLRIKGNESRPEILMYTFKGLLGYLGMNSHGLAIGINMVLSNDWQVGVSPYLLVRHLLEFSTVDECLKNLATIKRSSSRSFTIMDTKKLVNVELTAKEVKVTTNTQIFHTNHYLDPEFAQKDYINIFSKNSSIKRLEFMKDFVKNNDVLANPSLLFDCFSSHFLFPVGICAHAEGNIRRSETVGTVVMQPQAGQFFARKGYTCKGETQLFKITPAVKPPRNLTAN